MVHHLSPSTQEEEDLALALALSASLNDAPGPRTGTHGRGNAPPTSQPLSPLLQRPGGSQLNQAQPLRPAAPQAAPRYPVVPPVATAPRPSIQQPVAPAAKPVPYAPAPAHHPPLGRAAHPLVPRPGLPTTTPTSSSQPQPSSYSSSHPASSSAAAQQHRPTDPNACAGCGKSFYTSYITALGRKWHPACFKCAFCGDAINLGGNGQFAVGTKDHMPYHMDCYKHAHHPTCVVCGMYIPERGDGRIEYKENPFWREKYCPKHQNDGTPLCCACARYQPAGQEYVKLSDGRDTCLDCLNTITVDTNDAQPLYTEVLQFFRSQNLPHPERAPLMLVDSTTLNEFSTREGRDTTGGPVFHVRGLTLATVYRSIPTIVRSRGNTAVSVSTLATPMAQVRCNVTAILVLYGLPRLLTGCILAHELMHAWLRMKNVTGLDLKVEEGLCQLMAYIWLDQQHNKLKDSVQKRLASFFAYQIREDLSVVYGDGFREAYEAFQLKGLVPLINHVLQTGRLF